MEAQIKKLQRVQKFQSFVILTLLVVVAAMYFEKEYCSNEIIETKGIVITDESGKARMLMGFPIPKRKERFRTDVLDGVILLDENGVDRVHLGAHGSLFLGGKYQERMNDGWSLFFNDNKGEERSGYGFSDSDNSVGLGMDYGGEHGGEAIYLYAAPQLAFMTINADLQGRKGIRDRIVLWHETDKDMSLIKLSDVQRDGRLLLKAQQNDPVFQWTDSLKHTRNVLIQP